MGLIIPNEFVNRELPEDATDADGAITNAVTEATAFVNTWTPNYLEWDAYTEDSDENYTINAPDEIARICVQVGKLLYWQGQGQISRDGEEGPNLEARLEYYRQLLLNINIEPTLHNASVSLDSNGCQLLAQRQNIIPWNAYVTSATTNVWNNGEHFIVRKGGLYDDEQYDGWYLDASNYSDTFEGTVYYFRSYRRDVKDYMKHNKSAGNYN